MKHLCDLSPLQMKINHSWLFMCWTLYCLVLFLFSELTELKNGGWACETCHDNGKKEEGGSADCFSPTKAVKQRETWSEGEYRFALTLTHSHPPLFPLPRLGYCSWSPTSLSSGWDWSSSRWPQTGLGAPMALVILCGFGSVTAAWLGYGTLITLPPGGLRAAQRVSSRAYRKSFCLYMGIIPKSLWLGHFLLNTNSHF